MLKPYLKKGRIECGCDEAGRGCLAGPVVAAAVILPQKKIKLLEDLNDSKKLNEKQREHLRPIIEQEALAFAIGICDNHEIDKINILQASIRAMHKAIANLNMKPEFLLIDGNRFKKYGDIPHECIVKGDGKMLSIAAASVLAKTYRDDMMLQLDKEFPNYGWHINKAYPTEAHRNAIRSFGTTPYHRMSFKLLPSQLSFDL